MSNTQQHLQVLSQWLAPHEIITDAQDMAGFCIDQRRRFEGKVWAVVQPHSVEAVQKTVRYCYEQQIPLTPQGGNTSMCGGATPSDSVAGLGIIVSLSKLNRVREVNLADNCITVEAGRVLQQVQQDAAAVGRMFPLSLASEGSCQIGGNIACNAGGVNVVRYGPMRDLVMGLEVVLPNGDLLSHLSPLHKNTTGFDVKHALIGSEGTLGIITAATLKLFAPARTHVTAWVGVDSIDHAVALLELTQQHFAERLSSFELISDFALELSSQHTQLSQPLSAPWHVLLELTDSTDNTLLPEQLGECLLGAGFENAVLAESEQQREQLWSLRENISDAQRHLGASIKHDIAMPIRSVASFVHACAPVLQAAYPNAKIVVFGHLGDGSLHYNVFMPDVLSNDVYQYEAGMNALVYEQVFAVGGTVAAEHGIGQLKTKWMDKMRSGTELALMLAIKKQLDPNCLFNQGKVLPD
ncbi:FAD-binding oxidoreductase [Vitreoscilla massiliensis]